MISTRIGMADVHSHFCCGDFINLAGLSNGEERLLLMGRHELT